MPISSDGVEYQHNSYGSRLDFVILGIDNSQCDIQAYVTGLVFAERQKICGRFLIRHRSAALYHCIIVPVAHMGCCSIVRLCDVKITDKLLHLRAMPSVAEFNLTTVRPWLGLVSGGYR